MTGTVRIWRWSRKAQTLELARVVLRPKRVGSLVARLRRVLGKRENGGRQ